MKTRTTITIARQMGSGGSYVGQLIAQRLRLRYVDQEVLHLAAQALGVEEIAVEASSERLASIWEKIFGGLTFLTPESRYIPPPVRTFSDKELFQKKVEALKLIAARENAVIVGYGGALVLPCHPRMVNLYFHAPLKWRIKRVMEIYNLTDAEGARRMIEDSDEMRSRYFNQMTGRDWACADNYHLCIDTSILPLEDLSERLILFIQNKLG
ncbi:MAG TPA: cytidylate kinase-like family protein [Pyrinomonadaceae bacterium]